jgi:hypothetical protein
MPAFTLNPEALEVESFPTDPAVSAKPMKTNEPGCTLPEICGDGGLAKPRTFEPGCTLPEICAEPLGRPMQTHEPGCTLPELCGTG